MNGKNNKNGKLIIEGNAFYELDMQCLNQRRKKKQTAGRLKEGPEASRSGKR